MPQFSDHISQAKHNLRFLELVNNNGSAYTDWQVTVCYYVAVHLVNAHLALYNMQFRKHIDVKDAINPRSSDSVQKGTSLNEQEYLAYSKLQSLSRRSRYLVNEKDGNLTSPQACLTYEIHLARALRHLNCLICYFNAQHNTGIQPIKVACDGIKKGELFLVA